MAKCLYCYQPLEDEAGDFHQGCVKKFFGTTQAPTLPYAWDQLEELAREIIRRSVSVPGVQAKLSLHLFDEAAQRVLIAGRKKDPRLTLVGLWGSFILKPPVALWPGMPEIEDCTMHLAELFRIPAVPHSLIHLASGESAYITRRIDRDQKTNRPIHMEDFCQLSGKMTEQKYRGSLEGCAKIIKLWSSNALLDLVTFFDLALFSFLTGNSDMHLKNFSLIHAPADMISLSPAYDLLSTRLLISEKEESEEFALTMNGKKRRFTQNDFLQFGTGCGLSPKQMENSFKRFAKSLDAGFSFIKGSCIPEGLKQTYRSLVEERAGRLGI
jgi:serine/threonine-protein kinase HipA